MYTISDYLLGRLLGDAINAARDMETDNDDSIRTAKAYARLSMACDVLDISMISLVDFIHDFRAEERKYAEDHKGDDMFDKVIGAPLPVDRFRSRFSEYAKE